MTQQCPSPKHAYPLNISHRYLKTIGMPKEIRFGIRAHDLGCFAADELARRVSAGGFECVQLAVGKAIEDVDLSAGGIHETMVAGIAAAFKRHRVGIEVLGCYINPIHPDRDTRRSLYGLFNEHLRHARAFGCGIVALESGSLNGDYSHHPGNHGEAAFQQLLPVMRELVDEASRCGVVGATASLRSRRSWWTGRRSRGLRWRLRPAICRR